MISFRTIATMAKWDCQTIAATTERKGGEQSSAPVCHLREGGEQGTRGQSRRHKWSEVSMQKRTATAAVTQIS